MHYYILSWGSIGQFAFSPKVWNFYFVLKIWFKIPVLCAKVKSEEVCKELICVVMMCFSKLHYLNVYIWGDCSMWSSVCCLLTCGLLLGPRNTWSVPHNHPRKAVWGCSLTYANLPKSRKSLPLQESASHSRASLKHLETSGWSIGNTKPQRFWVVELLC